ncbi:MAG: Mu transposase C-terminal domain-containing protein, partial [Alphaproteobacteria bacterium]|nr:Mu transposase C-terminal domain-containing protein [Alphaproteobacteria bacterium]
VHFVTPYHGQAKPIERAFLDFCNSIARHPAFIGAYTGNSPANKPFDQGRRAIPLEDFSRIVDQQIAAHNARSGRRGGVCNGRSFDEVFAESYQIQAIRKATPEQQRLFLLASELVSTNRQSGAVKFLGNGYWDEALVQHAGKQVVIRFDPQALHQPIAVYTPRGEFICEASCEFAAGFNDTGAAREHAQDKKRRRKLNKELLDVTRRMGVHEAVGLIPEVKLSEDPAPSVITADFKRAPSQAGRAGNLALDLEPNLVLEAAHNVASLADRRRRL